MQQNKMEGAQPFILITERTDMRTITLIPGDGIGPEVAFAAQRLIDASGAELNWEIQTQGLV